MEHRNMNNLFNLNEPILCDLFEYLNIKEQINLYKILKKNINIKYINKVFRIKNIDKKIIIRAIERRDLDSLDFLCRHYSKHDKIIKYLLFFGNKQLNINLIKKYKLKISNNLLNLFLNKNRYESIYFYLNTRKK